jgi:hypothetical protein
MIKCREIDSWGVNIMPAKRTVVGESIVGNGIPAHEVQAAWAAGVRGIPSEPGKEYTIPELKAKYGLTSKRRRRAHAGKK